MKSNDPFYLFNQLTVGFDNLLNEISADKPCSFPKHNVYKSGENSYIVELALAGYNQKDLKISVYDNILTVKSDIKETDEEKEREYLAKNIAKRNFKFQLKLNKTLEVTKASMENGMLYITLEEDKEKVREIKIDIE